MHRQNAFTLIELLVVIAIIALLMSMLMPALGRAKKQAKAIVCQSRLHQWAVVVDMYVTDSHGAFLVGNTGTTGGWAWMEMLRPYYSDDELHLCPMALRVKRNIDYEAGGRFYAWNPGTVEDPLYGSYGLNGWLSLPPSGADEVFGRPAKDNWRTLNIKAAPYIPLILDCGIWDAWPTDKDEPPEYEDDMTMHGVLNDEIRRFCLNRHNQHVNGAFCDFSARKIGLKELWVLKWHRTFDINGPWTRAGGVQPEDWPLWIRAMKDY